MSSEVTALATAAAEADKVVKKQKVCSDKFASAVDSLLAAVNDSKLRLQNGKADSVLTELKDHVTQLGIPSELHDQTKQLHQAVAKLGKVSYQNCVLVPRYHVASQGKQSRSHTAGAGHREGFCCRHMHGSQACRV